MLHSNDPTDAGESPSATTRSPAPRDGTPGGTGTFENRLGATLVWLLFLGLALNIWPGWTRIAEWFHQN